MPKSTAAEWGRLPPLSSHGGQPLPRGQRTQTWTALPKPLQNSLCDWWESVWRSTDLYGRLQALGARPYYWGIFNLQLIFNWKESCGLVNLDRQKVNNLFSLASQICFCDYDHEQQATLVFPHWKSHLCLIPSQLLPHHKASCVHIKCLQMHFVLWLIYTVTYLIFKYFDICIVT